jgi:hypothetical protein
LQLPGDTGAIVLEIDPEVSAWQERKRFVGRALTSNRSPISDILFKFLRTVSAGHRENQPKGRAVVTGIF